MQRGVPFRGVTRIEVPVISAGLLQAHQRQHGWRHVRQHPAVTDFEVALADIDERHWLSGVGGVRLAGGLVVHLLDVAVVGGDQRFAADLVQGRRRCGRRTGPGIPRP